MRITTALEIVVQKIENDYPLVEKDLDNIKEAIKYIKELENKE